MGIWKSQSSGGTGTTNHSSLTNRDVAGNHAKLIPSADSNSAIQITKADGTTPLLVADTIGRNITLTGGLILQTPSLPQYAIDFASDGSLRFIGDGTADSTQTQGAIVNFGSNADAYGQINLYNANSGSSASGDYVITANDGTDSTKYVDLGINSSGFTGTGLGQGARNAYLYAQSDELHIFTVADKPLRFGMNNLEIYRLQGGNINIGYAGTIANNPRLLINKAAGTPSSLWQATSTNMSIFSEGASGNGDLAYYHANDAANARATTLVKRSRGTIAAPATIASGDFNYSIISSVFDGGSFRNTASIEFFADSAVSSGVAPQSIAIWTGATTSRTERLRVSSDGNVGINITAPTNKLHVDLSTGASTIGQGIELSRGAGYFRIANGTGSTTDFSPTFWTQPVTASAANSMTFAAHAGSDSDVANPIINFSARNKAGASTCSSTQRAVAFTNYTTTMMIILGNGNTCIGSTSPTEKLEVSGNIKITGNMLKMTGITTATRDGLTAVAGDIIYNITTNKHQGYNGSTWNDLY